MRRRRVCWFVCGLQSTKVVVDDLDPSRDHRREQAWTEKIKMRTDAGFWTAGRLNARKGECVYFFDIPMGLFDNNIDGPALISTPGARPLVVVLSVDSRDSCDRRTNQRLLRVCWVTGCVLWSRRLLPAVPRSGHSSHTPTPHPPGHSDRDWARPGTAVLFCEGTAVQSGRLAAELD